MKIKGIGYDFDGVMTNNLVYLAEDGVERVGVNRSDGLAVRLLAEAGLRQVLITTEEGGPAHMRAAKLGIDIISNCSDKGAALSEWAGKHNLSLLDLAFVGNDINDSSALRIVGYPVVTGDSFFDSDRSLFRLSSNGGTGCVRELAGYILGFENRNPGQEHFDAWSSRIARASSTNNEA